MSIQFQYYDTVAHGYTGILTLAGGMLITDGSGVPSFSATLPTTYVGQTSITTLGTIGTGTWQGGVIAGLYGGTGVANSGKTITLGGNLTASGAFATTLTVTATTDSTLPAGTHTLAGLDVAQTWSANQSINSGNLLLKGATSGTIDLRAAAIAGTNTLTLPAGTTDFSATGGTSRFVKQASAGAALTVAQPAAADLSDYAEGTWTPADNSGASLSLTVTDARYVRIGKLCTVSFNITYPVTVSGATNSLSGLPFTAYNGTSAVGGGSVSYTTFGASSLTILVGANSTIFQFYNLSGAAIPNSAASSQIFRATFTYQIA